MIVPRFGFSAIHGSSLDTDNIRLAATVFAFDVPLNRDNPYTTTAGDGINGVRVVWHFQPVAGGNSPQEIAQRWADRYWLDMFPVHPLAICRKAFTEYDNLVRAVKSKSGFDTFCGPSTTIESTRHAAILLALGHTLHGWKWHDYGASWQFHQASAADAALLADERLYDKLPDHPISYAKGALIGHEYMTKHVLSTIGNAQVQHRGRTAIIGRNTPKNLQDQIEKLLYRK
jgi:hypothetical protein